MKSRIVHQLTAALIVGVGAIWLINCDRTSLASQQVGAILIGAGGVWFLVACWMPPPQHRKYATPTAAARSTVEFDEESVTCRHSNGQVESVQWSQLQAVIIQTTDGGPWADDMFWWLVGPNTGCVVPSESTGMDELLKRLQLLPGFDNEAVVQAMTCTDNKQFACWKREEHQDRS